MRSTHTKPQGMDVHGWKFLQYMRRCPLFAFRVAVDWMRRYSESRITEGVRDGPNLLLDAIAAAAGRALGVSSRGAGMCVRSRVSGSLGRLVCIQARPGRQSHRRAAVTCEFFVSGGRPVLLQGRTRTPQSERPSTHLAMKSARALQIPKQVTS